MGAVMVLRPALPIDVEETLLSYAMPVNTELVPLGTFSPEFGLG